MPDDKSLPDEVAKLTEAVHELRDREVAGEIKALREEIERLRAEKDAPAPACYGHHHCGSYAHWHWQGCYPYMVTVGSPVYTQPTITTVSTGTNTWGSNTMTLGGGSYTVTN
jgi:hypothetical protein